MCPHAQAPPLPSVGFFPPRLESTPDLKLISLSLHNYAAASPRSACLPFCRTCFALLGWALEPQNSDYLPQHHPLCQVCTCPAESAGKVWGLLQPRPTQGTDAIRKRIWRPRSGNGGQMAAWCWGTGRRASPSSQGKVTLDQSPTSRLSGAGSVVKELL